MPLDTLVVHTRYKVVSPATHVAFVQHVRGLKAVGRHRDALGLWTSVVEFQHLPVPDENPRDIEGLPPLPKAVCSLAGCMRCESQRGGFHFPWLGVWCKRAVVPRDDATVAEAFQDLDSDPNYMDALQLQMYGSGCTVEHFLPPAWHNVFVRAANEVGCASRSEVFARWRDWQVGHAVWREPVQAVTPSREQAWEDLRKRGQRALVGWWTADANDYLPRSCIACGMPSRHVCSACLQAICEHCVTVLGPMGPVCCEHAGDDDTVRWTMPALHVGEDTSVLLRSLLVEALRRH